MKLKMIKSVLSTTILLSAMGGTILSASAAETQSLPSNGRIQFIADDTPTPPKDPDEPVKPVEPWDPTTPDHKPEPGTSGPLSLDFASSIDFGRNKISEKNQLYFANPQYLWNAAGTDFDPASARPNYVQITDKRGTNAGWTLSVKQDHQFKNDTTQNKVLTGSMISFGSNRSVSEYTSIVPATSKAGSIDLNFDDAATGSASQVVMSAANGAGAFTWLNVFGTLENVTEAGQTVQKNKAVTLSIPGSTATDAVSYQTKLTWTISSLP